MKKETKIAVYIISILLLAYLNSLSLTVLCDFQEESTDIVYIQAFQYLRNFLWALVSWTGGIIWIGLLVVDYLVSKYEKSK